VLLAGIALFGCDVASEATESTAAPPRVISGTGVIRGTVKFTGTAPAMRTIHVPCNDGHKEVVEESVVVNDNGTLRNVFVYLEDAPPSAVPADAKAPPLLDQVDCRYVPHAIGVQVGQELLVRSSDPTLHNVHALASANRAVNLSMTGAGQEKSIGFEKREFIPVKCDVHPWMLAYVGVFDNPWFAVTDESGSFEITAVPAGAFKLVTWHERYGKLEQSIEVDGGPIDVTLEYKAK
jgi:hypothetical protein